MRYSLASSRWVTSSVALALVLLALVEPMCVRAQDAPPPPATTVQMARDGVPGVWIPMTTFRPMTADLTAFRMLRDLTVPDLERLLALERAQSADLRLTLASHEESERVAMEALTVATAQTEHVEERVETMKRRRPWIFVAGVLVGVVVVVVPTVLVR